MDILTVLQTILRRWLVVVPIVLATAFVALVVGTGTEPEYELDGTVLLVSGAGASPSAPESSAVITAPVLAENLRSREASNRLAQAGATVPYVIEVDPGTSIMRVTATGPDAEANTRTVDAVLDNLNEELGRLEEAAGVAAGGRATVKLLLQPSDQSTTDAAIGSAFLIPSRATTPNPYPPSGYTTRVLEEVMLGAEARQRVVALAGGSATYSVTQQPRDPAPIVAINVLATDMELAEATFQAVKTTLDEVLGSRQEAAAVDDQARTRVTLLNTPAGAEKTSGTYVKSVATVVGLGLITAATAAILVESIAVSRAKRRDHELPASDSGVFDGTDLLREPDPAGAGKAR